MIIFLIVRSDKTLLTLLYFLVISEIKSESKYFFSSGIFCMLVETRFSLNAGIFYFNSFDSRLKWCFLSSSMWVWDFLSELSYFIWFFLLLSSNFFFFIYCFNSFELVYALYSITILMIRTNLTIRTALVATLEAFDWAASRLTLYVLLLNKKMFTYFGT